jgi:hypothetical protein
LELSERRQEIRKKIGPALLILVLVGGIFSIAYGFSSMKTQFNTFYANKGGEKDDDEKL